MKGVWRKNKQGSMCVDVKKNRLLSVVHLSNNSNLTIYAKCKGELSLVKESGGNGDKGRRAVHSSTCWCMKQVSDSGGGRCPAFSGSKGH